MPRHAPDAEFLRPGRFSVVQQVLPAVPQHSKFPRLVLPDGLSSPRWRISPPGLRPPLRRPSAVFCLTAAARRLRRTTSTKGRPVPSPPSPGPAQPSDAHRVQLDTLRPVLLAAGKSAPDPSEGLTAGPAPKLGHSGGVQQRISGYPRRPRHRQRNTASGQRRNV